MGNYFPKHWIFCQCRRAIIDHRDINLTSKLIKFIIFDLEYKGNPVWALLSIFKKEKRELLKSKSVNVYTKAFFFFLCYFSFFKIWIGEWPCWNSPVSSGVIYLEIANRNYFHMTHYNGMPSGVCLCTLNSDFYCWWVNKLYTKWNAFSPWTI